MASLLEKISTDKKFPEPITSDAPDCPTCRGSRFWWDRYGGGPHCSSCRPAPSKTLVARETGQIHKPDAEEPPIDLDDQFDRSYRCYVSRTGRRLIIERRDWTFLNAMIIDEPDDVRASNESNSIVE